MTYEPPTIYWIVFTCSQETYNDVIETSEISHIPWCKIINCRKLYVKRKNNETLCTEMWTQTFNEKGDILNW